MDVRDLVPRDKADLVRARNAVAAGFPAVAPVLEALVQWLQDANWPVAGVLTPFLQSIGEPLVPHIRNVLATNDLLWKYWVIGLLIPALPSDAASAFRAELERLALHPTTAEVGEELHLQAADVLQHFGWDRQSSS